MHLRPCVSTLSSLSHQHFRIISQLHDFLCVVAVLTKCGTSELQALVSLRVLVLKLLAGHRSREPVFGVLVEMREQSLSGWPSLRNVRILSTAAREHFAVPKHSARAVLSQLEELSLARASTTPKHGSR